MSNGSTSAYAGACRKDIPYPSVSQESVPSLIDNLVTALYGTITKTVVNRRVQWNIPCDPNNTSTINNIPRNTGEGLLCYIIRALNLTGASGFVTANGVQTLTNKTLDATCSLLGNATTATTAINIAGGVAGSIPYQTGVGVTTLLAQGTAGQVLSTNGSGALGWITNSTTSSATNNINGGTAGVVVYQTGVNTTGFTAAGTSGQVLISNGTSAPTWSTNIAGQAGSVANGSVTPTKLSTGGLSWDTSGNVGIGTSSPSAKLHVNGPILANGNYFTGGPDSGIFFDANASYNYGIFRNSVNGITIKEGGADRLVINAGGVINAFGNPITNCPTTAKAWVNFSGSGTGSGTATVNGSLGVSSVTRTATGKFTVNFNAGVFTASNYAFVGMSSQNATGGQGYLIYQESSTAPSTSSCTFTLSNTANPAATSSTVSIAFFGN